MFPNNQQVLFTCQKHDAEVAGTHYDYRIVVGDKAYSWATFKDLPEPGKVIILHEQPVHTREYSLSSHIIPSGQYGAGLQVLQYAKKGVVRNETNSKDKFVIETSGERYLIKHVPQYGEKQWLFKNLTPVEPIEKSATVVHQYQHVAIASAHKWITEHDKKPGKDWKPTGKVKHIRKGSKKMNNKYLEKISKEITNFSIEWGDPNTHKAMSNWARKNPELNLRVVNHMIDDCEAGKIDLSDPKFNAGHYSARLLNLTTR